MTGKRFIKPDTSEAEHIAWLDGPRGLAAVWVFLAHAQILSGTPQIPIISNGSLAVDLFMLLSGYLMTYHYRRRFLSEPWDMPSTWGRFWIRRWFRIAPLYYVLLVVSLCLGAWIGHYRNEIAAIWPSTATSVARYTDSSLHNLLIHVSFLFGALPTYAFRTPLPDWSIGLEMQFYFVFPFLMILFSRIGALCGGALLVVLCWGVRPLVPHFFDAFQMPSFLPIKLYVFVIGSWIALARHSGERRGMLPALLCSLVLCSVDIIEYRNSGAVGFLLLVVMLFYLADDGTLPRFRWFDAPILLARRFLSSPPCFFLGKISYSFYLVHLMILIPLAGHLTRYSAYLDMPSVFRFACCSLGAGTLSLALSWVLFKTIEGPGIVAGKTFLAVCRQKFAKSISSF